MTKYIVELPQHIDESKERAGYWDALADLTTLVREFANAHRSLAPDITRYQAAFRYTSAYYAR